MGKGLHPLAMLAGAGLAAGLLVLPFLRLEPPQPTLLAGPPMGTVPGTPIGTPDLAMLKLLEPTLYHVEMSYVEPDRIDYEAMYQAGLEAVERRVPAFRFTRVVETGKVNLEIGAYSAVLDVEPIGSSRQLQQELRRVAALLQQHLGPDDVPLEDGQSAHAEIEYALVNGVLDTLDPHSMLLPPEDASEMDVENRGEFGGLGITIVLRDGALVVERVLPGTPAEREGLHRHDRLVRIAGTSTMNMSIDEAVGLLRGPVGAPVEVEVEREGFAEPLSFRIRRALIKLNEVEGELLEGDVGVVRIETFHRHVEQELHATLARLRRRSSDGIRGLILDLRGNPGGYLNQAVAVADTFLEQGEIVSTIDGTGRRQDVKHAQHTARTEPPYPMVVLLDANSASASEIVAGALRNNERAVIVGERSFGKGSVQDLHQLYDNSKLKLTISHYLTPGDRSIQTVGIPADIELVPVRLDPPEVEGEPRWARVYWRERARREADLDHRLDASERALDLAGYTAYVLHYLDRTPPGRPSVAEDYAIRFARELILGAGAPRRPEMLAEAGRVVDRHARLGDAAIEEAFREAGIDWADGPSYGDGPFPVRATLDLGADGVLDAGVRETLTLTLTNVTDQTLYRVGALVTEHEVLEGVEFLFGKLEPGASRRFQAAVSLVDGYPDLQQDLVLSIRDSGDQPLGELRVPAPIRGRLLPELVWRAEPREIEGDADGVPEVGERIAFDVEVENRGRGFTGAAFVRLKNRSGSALDILEGELLPGALRAPDGRPCETRDRRRGCQLRLGPGERWSGTLEVELKAPADGGWRLDLVVGDEDAYDYAAVVMAGLHEYFHQRQELLLDPVEPLAPFPVGEPPTIRITRRPPVRTDGNRVTISGKVLDDEGVRHVMIYGGGDKLFYRGEQGGVRSVPFTAEVPLEPGNNVISVVAVDERGFSRTASVVTTVAPSTVAVQGR